MRESWACTLLWCPIHLGAAALVVAQGLDDTAAHIGAAHVLDHGMERPEQSLGEADTAVKITRDLHRVVPHVSYGPLACAPSVLELLLPHLLLP